MLNFDITASVQQMSAAPSAANYGWRVMPLQGDIGN